MEHVIYEKTVLEAAQAPDGDTPAKVIVTHERNGYVVWTEGYRLGLNPLGFWAGHMAREKALDHAVELAKYHLANDCDARTL